MYRAVKTNRPVAVTKRMLTSRTWIVMCLVTSALVGLALTVSIVERDTLTDGTELVFAFMLQRHGDRTPEAWMDYTHYGDVKVISALIAPWGYGQLTNKGIKTSYETGEFIRRRYKDFLPLKYNASEVYIRSTDVTRTKMSILSAMAAAFPPSGDTWSKDIHWVPVPYTTVEAKYDFMLGYPSCPYWVKTVHDIMDHPANISPYEDTVAKVAKILNDQNLTRTPVKIFYVNDMYASLISLGFDVGDEVRSLLPDIAAAAAKGWDILMAHFELVQLEAGVLLNEFFKYAKMVISGKATPKARIYSGHDINIYTLEAATLVTERQGIPKYGSLYALELRRVLKTGQYVVVPVYLKNPHDGIEKILEIRGCGALCDFDKFYNLTQKYLIDETYWRRKCGIDVDVAQNDS